MLSDVERKVLINRLQDYQVALDGACDGCDRCECVPSVDNAECENLLREAAKELKALHEARQPT